MLAFENRVIWTESWLWGLDEAHGRAASTPPFCAGTESMIIYNPNECRLFFSTYTSVVLVSSLNIALIVKPHHLF